MAKKIIPIETKTKKGSAVSAKPAPSIKMLLTPSASKVRGRIFINPIAQSGKIMITEEYSR